MIKIRVPRNSREKGNVHRNVEFHVFIIYTRLIPIAGKRRIELITGIRYSSLQKSCGRCDRQNITRDVNSAFYIIFRSNLAPFSRLNEPRVEVDSTLQRAMTFFLACDYESLHNILSTALTGRRKTKGRAYYDSI